MMKCDIATEEHIELLVNGFYKKVQADTVLAPLFIHVNWEKHLPLMYSFWSTMILGARSYRGNPFQRHASLPLEAKHFQRWISLFCSTVDEYFEGAVADETKTRAQSIAGVFQFKMGIGN